MKSCLIVDDSIVVRMVVRTIMSEFPFSTVEAVDGQQALEACSEAMPDAILLDWTLPDMLGSEFLRTLRILPGGDGPTVIICTTENNPEQIERALEDGANEYITKPFDSKIVEAKLQQLGLM